MPVMTDCWASIAQTAQLPFIVLAMNELTLILS
jgi:hypothetical protein